MLPYWNYLNDSFVFEIWPDAADLEPAAYTALMSTANAMCSAYAPVLSDETDIPNNYKLAEIFQARDIWSQKNAGNSDSIGPDGMTAPVSRFNFLAQDLLRPKTSPLGRLR